MMEKQLIYEITMPNYPRKIMTAKARRPKYFLFPKDEGVKQKPKYNSNRYQWVDHKLSTKKIEKRLFDTATNEFVIKNSRIAGTERWVVINGQSIYNGKYNAHTQGKIMETIHRFYIPFLQALKPIDIYPLHIECEIYDYSNDIISGQGWDVGNRGWPYCKAFDDVLQKLNIINNDSNQYVRVPCHPIFFPIKEEILSIEPHLIFKIYQIL
jgi:hypothetical protein